MNERYKQQQGHRIIRTAADDFIDLIFILDFVVVQTYTV